MKTLYVDCQAGISGDMFVAALLDLGASKAALQTALDSLHIDDFKIEITNTSTHGIVCTDYNVILKQDEHEHTHEHEHEHEHEHTHAPHVHRNLYDVEKLIDAGSIPESARKIAKKIFGFVAKAESTVHGLPLDQVHFHEVGAADSIADIIGAAVCVDSLGVEQILFSPLTEGSGFVRCAHGLLPVPAPATAEIMRTASIPYRTKEVDGEMVTPTGAAIAAGLSQGFGPMPVMKVEKSGIGCGKRQFPHANILRVFLGETEELQDTFSHDTICVLETCIDDSTGEALGHVLDLLFDAGVADAYFTPIYMKKNRPAFLLTVLCTENLEKQVARILFQHTGAIGLRTRKSERLMMQRISGTVSTQFGTVALKRSTLDTIEKIKPEFDSLKKVACEANVSLAEVENAVQAQISAGLAVWEA
ncbi:MAG TPA: nickel pincer cofactor biosynthesis protein LarC [Ruminococcaceae bacterium]|nr:nickel pincer cofactor biosynthesis protein LarC [Oscillospiraceae bacterium]